MIIVTGTKRSGTSMWMQILKAAGYEVLGEAFPRNWGDTIREANRAGFYESSLRRGIHRGTNPDPRTGEYWAADATQRTAVKVFVPGLVRSERSFVHKVVATMRPWREYKASVERLYVMDRDNRRALRRARGARTTAVYEPRIMPPLLAWWTENYALLCDARARRYPLRLLSYASVLADPGRSIARVLEWLGGGDADAAVAQVKQELRTQHIECVPHAPSGLTPDLESTLDELYARVHEGVGIDARFWLELRRVHTVLKPLLSNARNGARRMPDQAASHAL